MRLIACLALCLLASSCLAAAAVGAAGTVAGAAIGAAGTVVGATIDAAVPGDDGDEGEDDERSGADD